MSIKSLKFALKLKCPNCGKSSVYSGFMKIRDKCAECGLELKNTDAGDGPAYTAMFITAPLAVIFALIIESSFEPPMWVHFLISIPFITIASIILLIFLKPVYIALTLKK